jgi:hypothetical protein
VDVEDSVVSAEAWFVAHWDATFSASIVASVTGTTKTPNGDTTTTLKCSTSPLSRNTDSGALFFGGLSCAAIVALRRRTRRAE